MKGLAGMQKLFLFLFTLTLNYLSFSQMHDLQKEDSVSWQASSKYANPAFFKKLFLGKI
jgi:hypothetical protein